MVELWTDPTLRMIALGTGGLGAVAGTLGVFAILRRQSLAGDIVSHAALPGVGLGFLATGGGPIGVLIGAALIGWLALALAALIARRSTIHAETAMAGVLTVFFGAGTVIVNKLVRTNVGFREAGLDRILFGQAATLMTRDVYLILAVGLVLFTLVIVFWKTWKILCFDPQYAKVQGVPIRFFDTLLTGMIVIAIVLGLQAVGVVLMSALIVAPGMAARAFTNQLRWMVIFSGLLGLIAGVLGTGLSHTLSETNRTIPTGPTIVLVSIGLVGIAFAARPLLARTKPVNV
jgi:manganese/zinc/iron transport system permease protein